jgi:hypothetical protein
MGHGKRREVTPRESLIFLPIIFLPEKHWQEYGWQEN